MNNNGLIPEEVLRQRALLYANDSQQKTEGILDHLLVFCLAKQWFGISMKIIRKIEPFNDLLFVPRANSTVLGLANILGHFLPVIDIRQLLHLQPLQTIEKNTCSFIVIEPAIAFITNSIAGVALVSSSSIVFQEIAQEKNVLIRSIVEVKINNAMYQVAWLKDCICDDIL